MPIEKIEAFRTSDGTVFVTETEANRHEVETFVATVANSNSQSLIEAVQAALTDGNTHPVEEAIHQVANFLWTAREAARARAALHDAPRPGDATEEKAEEVKKEEPNVFG